MVFVMFASSEPSVVSNVNCFHPPAVEMAEKLVAISTFELKLNTVLAKAPTKTSPLVTVVPLCKVTVRAVGAAPQVTVVAEAIDVIPNVIAARVKNDFFIERLSEERLSKPRLVKKYGGGDCK